MSIPNVESWLNIGVPSGRMAAPFTSPRFGDLVATGPVHEAPSFVDSQRSTPCSAKPGVVAGAYSSTAPRGQLDEVRPADGKQPRSNGVVACRARPDLQRRLGVAVPDDFDTGGRPQHTRVHGVDDRDGGKRLPSGGRRRSEDERSEDE